jgi:hypothetical protein
VRQKEYVHQSESILKRQLGLTTKTLSRKAQMATDDNILLIQCVVLTATWKAFLMPYTFSLAFLASRRCFCSRPSTPWALPLTSPCRVCCALFAEKSTPYERRWWRKIAELSTWS